MTLGYAVVIPAHGAAGPVVQAIESIRHRSVPPQEIITVDNDSTDETAGLVQAMPGKFTVLCKDTRGPAAATWAGLGEAACENCNFVDRPGRVAAVIDWPARSHDLGHRRRRWRKHRRCGGSGGEALRMASARTATAAVWPWFTLRSHTRIPPAGSGSAGPLADD